MRAHVLSISLSVTMLSFASLSAQAQTAAPAPTFSAVPLVADIVGLNPPAVDASLVNPWGIASFPGGPLWISDNGTGLSTLYDGTGAKIALTVTVPGPNGSPAGFTAAPTGVIWNPSGGFLVPGTTLPALFLFATEDGTISAWAGGLPTNPTNAVLAVDNSASGAVYKALTFGNTTTGNYIYATNFNAGTIDVFDSKFTPTKLAGNFSDSAIPAGYAPFGIANVDGNLWVSYAVQNGAKHDDVAGAGRGIIDIFNTDGQFLKRVATGGDLNSPWAIAPVPYGFTSLNRFSGTVLIGNFGDGTIHAFNRSGQEVGTVMGATGTPLVIQGLWALLFGGGSKTNPQTLYYTAGTNGERDGTFGVVKVITP